MKLVKSPVKGKPYIALFNGEPVLVIANDTCYAAEGGRVFAKTCPVYELPVPTPPPATVKVKIKQLRGILREAEKLQATISTVANGTMKLVFGDSTVVEIVDQTVLADFRAQTLRKLGEELNALLTLKADAVDGPGEEGEVQDDL